MSEFVVSARKYRPGDWQEVVGQDSITSTLDKVINQDKLAHAYLFCGPRGVGKTTCARIFAKKINEDSIKDSNNDLSFNVFELDAASNNSVDDIRNLIDQIRIPPQNGKYKVYIVDEVHMLSAQAFNAFLKTLEEPPAHAIFILATTEKHKIIPTILSRCQVYDFNRITVPAMAEHLRYIAEKEGFQYDEDALVAIAKKADGALRDALSIFDQISSYSNGNITYQSVAENLSILDHEFYFRLSKAVLNENIQESLLAFHDILEKGFDGHHFLLGLIEHFRNLIMAATRDTVKLIETSENVQQMYQDHVKEFVIEDILLALEILGKADGSYRSSKNKRLLAELTLMQLCSIKAHQKKKSGNDVVIIPPSPAGIEINPDIRKVIPEKVDLPDKIDVKSTELKQFKPEKKVQQKAASFSIHGAIKQKDLSQSSTKGESKKMQNPLEKLNEPFDKALLEQTWKKFAFKVKKKGNLSFYSTLTARQPKYRDNIVLFEITNAVQEEDFKAHRTDILDFLRKELKNSFIKLKWKLIQDEQQTSLYTPMQKFNKMAESNPALIKFRNTFDLDIDF